MILGILGVLASTARSVFLYVRQPDIPRATLRQKYATAPSRFVVLPDGARVHIATAVRATARVLVLSTDRMLLSSPGNPGRKGFPAHSALSASTCRAWSHGSRASGDYSPEGMVKVVDEITSELKLGDLRPRRPLDGRPPWPCASRRVIPAAQPSHSRECRGIPAEG